MDELPELPFEKVLSYLSLEDRLKARAVSRRWYHKINCFRTKGLCFAGRPLGFIEEKRRLVSGALFTCNFIFSTKFHSFFDTFGRSILSNLKHLRLHDLNLKKVDGTAFAQTLNLFGQLRELGLFNFIGDRVTMFELNLPMLTSIQLEKMKCVPKLTLDAPRLQKIRLVRCSFVRLNLVIVHGKSVESLLTDRLGYTEVKNLKNLKQIYLKENSDKLSSTLLHGWDQLKEIHLGDLELVQKLFDQKQRYGRADLKIYFWGILLNGPDDPAKDSCSPFSDTLVQLTENSSRLADEIPFFNPLYYSAIQDADPEVTIDFVSRCPDLSRIIVDRPIPDIERFLGLLKNLPSIVELQFRSDHFDHLQNYHQNYPQDLFDWLPEHSAVQRLTIFDSPSDLEFLFRLKHLNYLHVGCPLEAKLIRKVFKEIPFLSSLLFDFKNNSATIEITEDSGWTHPKRYRAWSGQVNNAEVPDIEAAIQFLVESA